MCRDHKRSTAANTPKSKVEEAIQFRTAPDSENSVNVGEKPISKQEQKKCISISHNLIDKTVSPYFTEKYYQLLRMLADYEISEDTVNELTRVLDNCSKKVYPVNMSKPFTPFPSNQSGRPAIEVYPEDIEVTYELVDDYNDQVIKDILKEDAA